VEDLDLQHRHQRPRLRLYFNSGCNDRIASVREYDYITGLKVRRRVFEETEVVTGCVVEAVDRHVHGVSTGCWRLEIPRERAAAY
jgi:hypothetical protein